MLTLRQALRLEQPAAIAFVGAGGKTTALFQLARQFGAALLTTSTHLGAWQISQADTHLVWMPDTPLPDIPAPAGVCLLTGPLDPYSNRYNGLNTAQLTQLRQSAKTKGLPLLIEADGARQKPLKAPAAHEPALPGFVDLVVVTAGLSGLDKPLGEETAHRAGQFAALSGLEMGEAITAAALARILTHAEGGLKNIPAGARRVVLLNQADTGLSQAAAGGLRTALLPAYDGVVVASLAQERIWAVFEPVMAVVLAAGAATRYGQPKQLLDYHGEAFVRRVAKTALAAGLAPVVVVSGASAQAVEAAVADLPVEIVHNPNWQEGQASSIRAGLSLNEKQSQAGAVIFLLADQPQVTPHVLDALKSRHAEGLFPIVAPLVADRRGSPVLFDRVTFADLRRLTGDVGGRALFREYALEYVPWYDESLLLDVDSEADYRKLLAWGVEDER